MTLMWTLHNMNRSDNMFKTAMSNWHWQSDWNGYEVGYPEHNVVGLYSKESESTDQMVYIYVDTESGQILDIWTTSTEEEEEQ